MENIVEEWRDIEGYPGYQVSNLGRVRSLDRWVKKGRSNGNYFLKGQVLKNDIDRRPSCGYYVVHL